MTPVTGRGDAQVHGAQVSSRPSRIVLWSAPRCASTAFEKAFSQRDDTEVVHEPFADCYYFSRARRSSRYGTCAHLLEYDAAAAEQSIRVAASPVIFIKELAFQALPYVTSDFIRSVTNTFIVRRPAEVVESLYRLKPDFTEDELGFTALEELWRRARRLTGGPPIVVESTRLRRFPGEVLKQYCNLVGLRFDDAMLRWTDGRLRQWLPHEAQSQAKWHVTLERSRGILPPGDVTVDVLPKHLAAVERAQRIYESIVRYSEGPA
jgi:hypothetical protein